MWIRDGRCSDSFSGPARGLYRSERYCERRRRSLIFQERHSTRVRAQRGREREEKVSVGRGKVIRVFLGSSGQPHDQLHKRSERDTFLEETGQCGTFCAVSRDSERIAVTAELSALNGSVITMREGVGCCVSVMCRKSRG